MDLEKAYMQGRFDDAVPYIDWGDGEELDYPNTEIVIKDSIVSQKVSKSLWEVFLFSF